MKNKLLPKKKRRRKRINHILAGVLVVSQKRSRSRKVNNRNRNDLLLLLQTMDKPPLSNSLLSSQKLLPLPHQRLGLVDHLLPRLQEEEVGLDLLKCLI